MKPVFWKSSQKKAFMICVGGNTCTKSCLKTFLTSLGEFVQKSFAPQKFACSYTCGYELRPGLIDLSHDLNQAIKIMI